MTTPDSTDPDPAPVAVAPPPSAPVSAARRGFRTATEWVLIVAGAIVVALVIKATLVQAFYIPSESMVPTLHVGDRVLVNKLSYRLHDVHRGDIVVFERPRGEADPQIRDLIKRVIGLPGETIEARGGRVYVNDRPLEEPYLTPEMRNATQNLPRQLVPPDHYFVLGDNRANSRDSRVFGPIPGRLIVGRAFIRVWPINDLSLL